MKNTLILLFLFIFILLVECVNNESQRNTPQESSDKLIPADFTIDNPIIVLETESDLW